MNRPMKGVFLQGICVFVLAWCAVGPTAAACLNETYELTLPRQVDAAALPQKEHVLASVLTSRGMLEARATPKNGTLGEIGFHLGGKPFREVSRDELPAGARKCLKQRRGEAPEEGATGSVAEAVLDWLVPSAQAYWFRKVGRGCTGKGTVTVVVIECFDEGGGPVCAVELRQGGRVCGYAVV